MIWCFEFFFLRLHNDLDEGSQQLREVLLVLSRFREIMLRPDYDTYLLHQLSCKNLYGIAPSLNRAR